MPQSYSDPSLHGQDSDVVPPELIHTIESLEASGYSTLAQTIRLILQEFPDKAGAFHSDRIASWIAELEGGAGRSEDDLRDNIFEFIVTPADLMTKYGVDEQTALDIINGGNEGGVNFGDFLKGSDAGGDVTTRPGTPGEEDQQDDGVGGGGEDEETQLTILTNSEMKWYFDKNTGKWYVSYGLPNSDRELLYEATPEDMDSLFGSGQRPTQYDDSKTLRGLLTLDHITFGGDIAEMEGTGSFEGEMDRIISLALDEGRLPDWAAQDGAMLDLLFIAQSEGKSQNWLIEQMSSLPSFQERFGGAIGTLKTRGNLTTEEAVTAFLEMEAGVRQAMDAAGYDSAGVTPQVVGGLIDAGHSLTVINQTVGKFKRMEEYAPAMEAFNQILAANELPQISSIDEMFAFVSGQASADVYNLWEASSFAEAANLVGLGDVFTAEDAISMSLQTEGSATGDSITQGFQKAAQLALQLRHQVDIGQFGLDVDDLIDVSIGRAPTNQNHADIMANISRAVSSAQRSKQQQAGFYTGFSESGTPQQRSLANLRQSS